MKKTTIATALLLNLAHSVGALESEIAPQKDLPDRSLTFTLGGTGVYKDSFGGLSPAYSAMVTWNYHLSEDYLLGINFLRFEHHPGNSVDLKTFAYGFTFQHFWKKKWGDTGLWTPYAAYSILLNQALRSDAEGRAMGHNTRIALGTEYRVSDIFRLGLEGVWNYVTYPRFGGSEDGYQNLGTNLTVRWLL